MVVAVILAGCGGSSTAKAPPPVRVHGNGFSFEAPAGWTAARSARHDSASRDSELVQVATFPLLKPYRPGLFDRVAVELRQRMAGVARQTGGTVSAGATVTAGGIRSHSYRVTVGDHVDEYTFALRGLREFQLLCRRKAAHDDSFCARLIASFRPA